MTQTQDLLSAVYEAAADDIENRTYVTFSGGREVWGAVYQAMYSLLAHPAVEGLARHLKLEQVQHWRADQDTVVKTLRELAACPEQLDLLQAADTDNRIARACRLLRETLGHTEDTGTLGQIARDAADTIRRLGTENARMRGDLDRLAQQNP